VDARRSVWHSSAALPDSVVAVPSRTGEEPPLLLCSAGRTSPGLRLCACVLLLVLGFISAGCAALGLGQTVPEARPPVPARAAYVAEDGHVYVIPLAGGDARRVSQIAGLVAGETTAGWEAPTGRWPTWAPDGSRIAFVRLLLGPGDTLIVAQLWTVAHDGAEPRKVWEATDQEPIYLAWAPNSALIALLVQTTRDLELILVDTTAGQPPRRLAQGNPFYYTWSSDSQALLLHVGDTRSGTSKPELGVLRLGPPDEFRSFGIVPGNFRTPGWSADGRKVAFVADGPDGVPTVSLVSPEGGDIARIATATGQTALALTPDGARLAWSSRSEADRLAYDGLEVVSTDGRRRTRVTSDLVIAFFWSPDHRQLAFVTLERGGSSFAWNVADADGTNARRLGMFTPTPDQIRLLAFFDQYAISHGLWSPDSSRLAYASGQPGDQRVFGTAGSGTVQTVLADGSERATTLVGGNFVALPVPAP
jgi:TolB protein